MSLMGQHLIRILRLDRRYFPLNNVRLNILEDTIRQYMDVTRDYDPLREKHIYSIKTPEGLRCFESKHRGDALCKLILWTPALYEPVRIKYNEMVEERFKSNEDKKQERAEARYQRRMDLIRRLSNIKYS